MNEDVGSLHRVGTGAEEILIQRETQHADRAVQGACAGRKGRSHEISKVQVVQPQSCVLDDVGVIIECPAAMYAWPVDQSGCEDGGSQAGGESQAKAHVEGEP